MKIRLLFAWYDCWVGAYWNEKAKTLYLMLPFIGLQIKADVRCNQWKWTGNIGADCQWRREGVYGYPKYDWCFVHLGVKPKDND